MGFCREVLGVGALDVANRIPGLWGKLVEILEALCRYRKIAIPAGHGVGKSFTLALALLFWVYARGGMVVTTASTWNQVKDVLWREVATRHRNALVELPGELLQVELKVTPDMLAIGLSVNDPTAFQGRHHPDLLVIVDEAPGVPDEVHQAIDSLATGERNVVVKIGNPTQSIGEFYEDVNGGRYHVIHISSLEHPNVIHGVELIPGAVTVQWVEDMRARWGEDSPVWQSRVLGEFPEATENQVNARAWVEQAMSRPIDPAVAGRFETILGVDVARYGDNKTVIATRRGNQIVELVGYNQRNTMEVAGLAHKAWQETAASLVVVDEVGVGAGVVDRLMELGVPVVGFNSGRPALDKTLFNNQRAEMWWRGREKLQRGELTLPNHRELFKDLIAPTYRVLSTGKIKVETKEELALRGVQSSDWADAVLMTFAVDELAIPEEEPEPEEYRDTNTILVDDMAYVEAGFIEQRPFGQPDETW